MLIDVFTLLNEARQRIVATTEAINARREFWLAATNLDAAITVGGIVPGESGGVQMTAAAAAGAGH